MLPENNGSCGIGALPRKAPRWVLKPRGSPWTGGGRIAEAWGAAKPARPRGKSLHGRQTLSMEPDTSALPRLPGRPPPPAEIPDFRRFFEAAPGLYLVVRADVPRFTIVAASDAYLRATLTAREGPRGIIGLGIFEAFPDPPGDPGATGVRNLRASLERALVSGTPDRMAVQAYPIPRPDGTWEERHWSPLNTPIRDAATGQVTHLIHQVEDVTESIRLAAANERLRQEKRDGEQSLHRAEHANAALAEEGTALREANQALQEQAVELEMQADELREGSGAARGAKRGGGGRQSGKEPVPFHHEP